MSNPHCPECGRRPSERHREHWYVRGTACSAGTCAHFCHDAADAALEMLALLAVVTNTPDFYTEGNEDEWIERRDALLSRFPEEGQ